MTTATSIVRTARSGSTGKIVSAREAVLLIRSGDTVAISGFGGIGFAEEVVNELAAVYKASDQELASFGRPSGLTLMFGGRPFVLPPMEGPRPPQSGGWIGSEAQLSLSTSTMKLAIAGERDICGSP